MAMTLRLDEADQRALEACAETEGLSMQEVVRRAIREYAARRGHRDRVAEAADRVLDTHAEAIERLGA